MAQKTYQQIQAEADRLFGKGASDAKFAWRRSQQTAAGLAPEKRQRGGVAEVWDRNKRPITTAAELIAGYFGGPKAATATGALIRGVDRPGKRGIGFDVGQGARGAMEGYLTGGLGAAARGAIAPKAGVYGGGGLMRGRSAASALQSYFTPGVTSAVQAGQSALDFAKKNPAIVAQALQSGLAGYSAAQQAEMERQQMDIEEQLREEERARKRRLAQLLAPALQAQATPYTAGQ